MIRVVLGSHVNPCQPAVKNGAARVGIASDPLGKRPSSAFTRFRRARSKRSPLVRRRGRGPRSLYEEKKEVMPDLAYLALTVVCFIVLALVVKAVEKL